MFDDEQNPYASPKFSPLQVLAGDVSALCKHRGWCSRTIVLEGLVDAEVRYDGMGFGERVYVNGRLAAKTRFFTHYLDNVTPHVDFSIDSPDGRVDAALDVRASLFDLLRITKFVLSISGCVVYAE